MNPIARPAYLDWLTRWRDKDVIKVVSGVRRCGKSTLLELFQAHLLAKGVRPDRIISINFESIENERLTDHRALYNHVAAHLAPGQTTYVFLDEIQQVDHFERAVDALFVLDGCDLYLTGSNAYLMSSELGTLLSGRYVELKMLPLSFAEFADGIERITPGLSNAEKFERYVRNGSLPYTVALADDERNIREYLDDVYHSILLKDVVERFKITEVTTLERIARFLSGNIGSLVSTRNIVNTLKSSGRSADQKTVDKYVRGLTESLLFYEVPRWNIKGKDVLVRLSKFYAVDTGLRANLVAGSASDVGHILENIVFLELLRRGFAVYVGQLDSKEVDFVAVAGNDFCYYQVAASALDPATLERELAPLRKIPDSYPKYLITLDTIFKDGNIEGIRKMNAIDWLLAAPGDGIQ